MTLPINNIKTETLKKKTTKKVERISFSELDSLTINWNEIHFLDEKLKIKIAERRFILLPYLKSRESFNHLKPLIIKRNMPFINIMVINGRISKIINMDILHNVIKFLEIQTFWNDWISNKNSDNSVQMNKFNSIIGKDFCKDFLKIRDRSIYINYLCEIQDKNFAIIPVLPLYKKSNTSKGDSFLFTIVEIDQFKIIWESPEVNKATYIFNSNPNNYQDDLQTIFDFISSFSPNIRLQLRNKSGITVNKLSPQKIIYHSTFENWKENIHSKKH